MGAADKHEAGELEVSSLAVMPACMAPVSLQRNILTI